MLVSTSTKLNPAETLVNFLGVGARERKRGAVSGRSETTLIDLHTLIHARLPYSAFEKIAQALNLPIESTAKVLGIPKRTLARRKDQDHLEQYESERVMRMARVFLRAVDVLGTPEKASIWLGRENRALGRVPLSLMDTDVGTEAVLDVLGRIEHGVVG